MPRPGSFASRAIAQVQQAVERKDNVVLSVTAERMLAEWEARCGEAGVWDFVSQYHAELGIPFPDDGSSADPGPWLEMWWRLWLRQEGSWGYQHASEYRGWSDKALPLSTKAREQLESEVGRNMSAAMQRKLDAESWGGITAAARTKAVDNYITTALYFRPHGFSSVGCVPSDAPLGRLLLHGLHIFLATAFDIHASAHLHTRHVSAVVIQDPRIAWQHYNANLTTPSSISSFTGNMPPVSAQVPLFDHLALHWQLKLATDVLTGLLVPPAGGDGRGASSTPRPPPDTPYHWSAFNKLLLLGMYAPVEEAMLVGNEQDSWVAVQQLQDLTDAREAESASARHDMRTALTDFRVVLHEQLQAELAAGQAALQMCAAALQEQQSNQQQQPVQLMQLKQQLQACHLADLWAQQSSSSNNDTSSGSGADVTSPSRSRQLTLVLCALIAWPLAVLSDTVVQSLSPTVLQPHQQSGRTAAAQDMHEAAAAAESCRQQLQQVIHTAANGMGGEQQSSSGSHAKGLQDLLLRQLGVLSGLQQQQQDGQEDEEWQEALEEEPLSEEQLLMALMVQLLGPLLQGTSGNQQHPGQHAGTGAGRPAAAQHAAQGGCGAQWDAIPCVTLQAVVRCVCHVLLVRLLAAAPRCEDWSWECCTALLQLLVSCQQAAGAASNLLYATLAASSLQCNQSDTQQQQQQQQRQEGEQQPDVEHAEAARAEHVKLLAALKLQVAQRLLQVLHGLHQTEEPLQPCSSNDSSSGGSSSSVPVPQLRQQQTSSQGRGRKAMRVVQDDTGQQQEVLTELNQPDFWRSQTFQLYTTSRSSGSTLLKGYFHDWRPDNHRPGFWGVVGKFAAADQLNLRHSQDPTALAAAPPAVTPHVGDADDSRKEWAQQPVAARMLARIANIQLLSQGTPALELGRLSDGMPVQLMALDSLLQCALLAAQQPQLLPYASLTPAAQRQYADRDRDVFRIPATSPEPAAASRAGSACRANGAAAAAAVAAAHAWEHQAAFHLRSVLALGPLFEEAQQGPCLVRLTQLLMQFHAETAAAASSALQHHLQKDLKQHRLWVPPFSSCSNRSSGGTETSYREVPPDRSRLLVLLMGLYHLQMLEQQQDQRRRQQFRQAQQQKEQEWAQQQADRRPKQQQQQQQEQNGAHVMAEDGMSRLRPMQAQMNASRAAAAAHFMSPYDDLQIKRKTATCAAAAAYSMPDMLLYCLAAQVEQYTHGGNSSSSSSSNRFEVCTVSAVLVADGTRLSSQVLHGGNSMPADATCDVCSARMSLQIEQQQGFLHMIGQRASPPAAVACDECGGHFWMCTKCAASADVAERHDRFCSAAGTAYSGILQTASKAAGAVLSPSVTSQLNSSSTSSTSSSTPVPHPCACNACSRALLLRSDRASLRWRCSPLVQSSGPWAPEQRYGLQPQWQQQQQRQQQLGLLKPRVQKEPQHVTELKRACGLQSCGVPYGPSAHTAPAEFTIGMLSRCGAYQQERYVWEAKAEGV